MDAIFFVLKYGVQTNSKNHGHVCSDKHRTNENYELKTTTLHSPLNRLMCCAERPKGLKQRLRNFSGILEHMKNI